MTSAPDIAIVMDIDGVIIPIDGSTTFGDDQIAGHMLGPVTISPTLARRLDDIARRPNVTAVWLTSWPTKNRLKMTGFPGRDWPDLKPSTLSGESPDPDAWWKPVTLRCWLNQQPQLRRLVWCDDGILHSLDDLQPLTDHRAVRWENASPVLEVVVGDLPASLLVPCARQGLTAMDLDRIERLTRA